MPEPIDTAGAKWRVRCGRCGNEKIVLAANLLRGRTKTCGCGQPEKARLRMIGAARVSKVLGPSAMEAYAWDGAEEHLARARTEIEANRSFKTDYDQS